MSKIRAFIAIQIPDSLRQKIANIQNRLIIEQVRISWIKPENLHLTLKFLGDIEKDKIDKIAVSINRAARTLTPFSFYVKNLGAFPNIKQPRVFWVGVQNNGKELVELSKKIENELKNLGFQANNHRFKAHITIGRVKSQPGKKFIEQYKTLDFNYTDIVAVENIDIIKSDLQPEGALYTPLKTIKIG